MQALQFTESFFACFPASQAVQLIAASTSPVALPAEHEMQSSVTAEGAYFPAVLDCPIDRGLLVYFIHRAGSVRSKFTSSQN